jgi:hypothetical protein
MESAWFREPTRRERRIGAGLFLGFGVFFFGLAWVQRGWWFAWVILGLGGISIWYAGYQMWRSWRIPKSEIRNPNQ